MIIKKKVILVGCELANGEIESTIVEDWHETAEVFGFCSEAYNMVEWAEKMGIKFFCDEKEVAFTVSL